MRKLRTLLVGGIIACAAVLPALTASAAGPTQPNCLGQDVKGFAKALAPLGQNVVKPLAGGGFNDEVLGHLQGVPDISNCPDGGFPSHIP